MREFVTGFELFQQMIYISTQSYDLCLFYSFGYHLGNICLIYCEIVSKVWLLMTTQPFLHFLT